MSRASSPVLRIGNSAWRPAIYTVGAVAVLFALMLIYASPGLLAYHGYFPAAVGPEHVLARSLATFGLGTSASIGRAAPLFALALVGIVWLALRRTSVAVFLGLYALLPVALVSVLFAFRPMFDERYLIVLAPGYLLLLAAGLSALFGSPLTRPIGALAAVGVLALTIPTISGTYREMLAQRADYRGMAAWVSTYGGRDDPVVATGHGQADLFAYYSRGQPAPQVLDQPARLASTLPGLLAAGRGIWLLPYWQEPADVAALDLLKRDAVPVADGWFNNARALYFASASGLTLPSAARGTWDGQIALDGARLTGGPVQAGEALGVELHWKASAAMPTPKVSFRLLDANGDVVAQHDTTLAAADRVVPGEAVTRTGLFVPAIAAPGWYTAALLLYHPSGDSLRLATDYPSTDNLLTLGQIAVARHTRPVPPQAVVVGVRDNVVFPAGVTVMGHDPVGGSYVTGDTVTLRLVWRADRSGLPDLSRTLELRDPTGQAAATTTEPILASYTTSAWQAGQMIEERPRFRIPPTVGSGAYHLVLRVAPGGERSLDLGVIAVSGPDHSFARPTFSRSIGAQLGSFATLLGIDLDRSRVTPGTRLGLTLYWAARGAADRRYTLFIHLVDPSGQIRGQIDRPPLAGARPTDGWVAGEYLRDAYDPPLASDAPPGSYAVEVGLYDPATGARVPVVLADGSAADQVVVATVEVGP